MGQVIDAFTSEIDATRRALPILSDEPTTDRSGMMIKALVVILLSAISAGCATTEQTASLESGAVSAALICKLLGSSDPACAAGVAGAVGPAGGSAWSSKLEKERAALAGHENDLDARLTYVRNVNTTMSLYNVTLEKQVAVLSQHSATTEQQVGQKSAEQAQSANQLKLIDATRKDAISSIAVQRQTLADMQTFRAQHASTSPTLAAEIKREEAILQETERQANAVSQLPILPRTPPDTTTPYGTVTVFFATDRNQVVTGSFFGATRSDRVTYGEVRVSIPLDHQMGALEAPSIWTLRFSAVPEKDVMVLDIAIHSPVAFFSALREKVHDSGKKSLLVFVHGFNVSFQDAARRTAQMAYDLGFDGAPVFFSWPSKDDVMSYTADEQSIIDAEPHLKQFLNDVLQQSDADNIYLIAHSMGNRGLTKALAELAVTEPKAVKRIKEVILAAPDIGTVEFTEQIVPELRKLGAPVTLYASSNDRALAASQRLHGGTRAGESGDHLVVVKGIETIDASDTDTDLIGHSYYGDRRTVLADMWYLINSDLRASQRCCLKRSMLHSQPYWVFLK